MKIGYFEHMMFVSHLSAHHAGVWNLWIADVNTQKKKISKTFSKQLFDRGTETCAWLLIQKSTYSFLNNDDSPSNKAIPFYIRTPLLRYFAFYPPPKKNQSADTLTPLQCLKDQGCRHKYPFRNGHWRPSLPLGFPSTSIGEYRVTSQDELM